MGNYLIHPLLLLILLTAVPLMVLGRKPPALLGILSLASLGPPLLYAVAQHRLHPATWLRNWLVLPILMLFGLGLAFGNSIGVWQGLRTELVEMHGADNLVWCVNGGVSLQLRLPGDRFPPVGSSIALTPDVERISLFDAATGDRI
jgi:hypothetical protein